MIALSIANATLILGSHSIFRSLTWEIQHDQKIGLVGPNGAGKSSLFKLIIGEHRAEPGGAVIAAKGITLGYLPQHPEFDLDRTALALALEGNPRIAALESALSEIEIKLGQPEIFNDAQALGQTLESQQKYLDEYGTLGGSSYPARVRTILRGLGLPESDFEKPLGALSGGQKKLIGLARLILFQPSILLLDEPDNHLDIPGKAFLEKLINEYRGAVVIVSHDRYLLDTVVTDIAEIEDGKLTTFKGNYTEYIVDKEERLARQDELYQIQQRAISRMEMALKRYKLWVQFSDKFASRIHAMEARIERVERIDQPTLERRKMDLQFNGWRGSNQVLEFVRVSKVFTKDITTAHTESTENNLINSVRSVNSMVKDRKILKNINLLIRHGERVGLIGANGAGKSVFLRLVLGAANFPNTRHEPPTHGEIKLGPSVKIGYYAQEHETLDFNQTLIDTVRLTGNMSESNAVALLIRYLFTYQQATQKIATLSGGERSRLQLLLVVLSGANFLLLDEPTNNLDIASAEVLENALNDFNGTVLVISHDRYFLDRTVNRILELENATITEYIGGYSDYVERKGRE